MRFTYQMKSYWQSIVIALLSVLLVLGMNLPIHSQNHLNYLVQTARVSYQQGNFDRSLELLRQAVIGYQEQGKTVERVQVLSLISLTQQQLGNWQEAQKAIDSSLSSIESLSSDQNKQRVLAQIYNAKGHLEYRTGKSELALHTWQRSEKLYRAVGDAVAIKGNSIDIAQAEKSLGFYRRSCNSVLEALVRENYDCQELSDSQLKEILEEVTSKPNHLTVKALTSLGNSLLLMAQLPEAQAVMEESQTLNAKLSPPALSSTKTILLSLGDIHRALARQAKAREEVKIFRAESIIAINFYRQVEAKKLNNELDSLYRLEAQINRLNLYIATEQWQLAQNLADNIDFNFDRFNNTRSVVATQINLARALTLLKQHQIPIAHSWTEIAELYRLAAIKAQNIGDIRSESYAWGYLGQIAAEHQLVLDQTPEELLTTALNLAQTINAGEIAYRWQWQLGKIYLQRNPELAISAYQASVATLTSLRTDLVALDREIQFSFKEQVEPVYRELANLLLTGNNLSQARLKQARDTIEALQLAELDNYFQDACLEYQPKEINDIDAKAAAIYTIILKDRLEIILATSDRQFHRYKTVISKNELTATIEQLQESLVQPDLTLQTQKLAGQIYNWLIKPLETDLNRISPQTLVFVADGQLQSIPMSVLYDGKQYLMEKYAIAITPGLQLVNLTQKPKQPKVLAAGISESRNINKLYFAPLPNVKAELANIRSQLPGEVLLNNRFNLQEFTEKLNSTGASIVHLATHGQFSSNPDRAFLLSWDNLLNIKDFSNLLLQRKRLIANPIDLLILSACETASGDNRATLGLAGMSARTGANTTLATMWQIEDNSTAVLIKNFYQILQQKPHLNKAQALQQAQLKLRKNFAQDWEIPYIWSSYILVGNWQ
jgi:CHAT domain-containing protein/tetratricopeptide (TPR) repeat protein